MSALLTATSVAAGTLVVTVVFGWLTARRAQYERVIEVIQFASEGEVAKARHRLGTLLYAPRQAFAYDEAVEDVFTILWAFTRINAVRHTLPPLSRGPARLLRSSVQQWAADWCDDDFERVCARINAAKPRGSEDLLITWSRRGLDDLAGWDR